jgi:diguanylate cyclase (GGDEF)-like protein
LDGEALLLKLETYLRSKREVDRIQDENLVDHNTGLYNMRGLTRRAKEISSEAFRRHHALACIVFAPEAGPGADGDVEAQDLAGQVAGLVAQVIRSAGRVSDATGRVGPAEFAVIAPATETDGVIRLIQRLNESIEAAPLPFAGREHRVRLKAGYCAVPDFASSDVDAIEMLLRATTALRYLRSEGTNGYIKSFEQVPLN